MRKEAIPLPFDDPAVNFSAFLPDCTPKGAILILPGGAYLVCAETEGPPVAERFSELGYAAFLLNYSVSTTGADGIHNKHTLFPEPLREVAASVKYMRKHALNYGFPENRIAVMGSSAGGHLAATYSNYWNQPGELGIDPADFDGEALRPNACILLYGATEFSRPGAMPEAVWGHGAPYTEEEYLRYRVHSHINAGTPPMILFHSVGDPTVPVGESLRLFEVLREKRITAEMHIFAEGGHAYGLGTGTCCEAWPVLADRFLQHVFS